MDSTTKSKADKAVFYYDTNYGHFETELYSEIRREAFGQDLGQNSWLTASEQERFLNWLDLSSGKVLLDVACGAGGPALRIAATTGCSVVGIEVHEQAVATAVHLRPSADWLTTPNSGVPMLPVRCPFLTRGLTQLFVLTRSTTSPTGHVSLRSGPGC